MSIYSLSTANAKSQFLEVDLLSVELITQYRKKLQIKKLDEPVRDWLSD